jgi:hypothetical protein
VARTAAQKRTASSAAVTRPVTRPAAPAAEPDLAEAPSPVVPAVAAAPAVPVAPAASAPPPLPGLGTNFASAVTAMMKNPQMKEMMRAQQKVMLDQMYGALPKYLNMTAEQHEHLRDMLLDRQMALAEGGMALLSGTADDRQKAAEQLQKTKAEYDRAIQEFLGPEAGEVFKQYEEVVPDQMQVTMFAKTLGAEQVLSEQQEYDLVAALHEERKQMPQDSLLQKQGEAPDPSQMTEERVQETLRQMDQLNQRHAARAEAILSGPQLEHFKQWQEQMAGMQRMGLNMAAQMFGQGKAGAAAPPQ